MNDKNLLWALGGAAVAYFIFRSQLDASVVGKVNKATGGLLY